ncbi:hypothetical protein Aph01nite_27580 [Acrocarpospora phusangensis]|uniref:DUF4386 family protein n=1 Tax=Acrocarpospora phusangensis TaxID=1070424 RepID=A0A919QBP3_9ACTN|nr:hypothetical protein [Acrocarpospora phusangensis]GIH24448.1 hypothetical protein Aph01nite_27580 [Acrocarpospora phusangensis]
MTSLDTTPRSGADTFARYAMVAGAFLSPLLIALALLLSPIPIGVEGEPYVQEFAAAVDSYPTSAWLGALSAVLLVPGLLGAARVARSGKPVLGLAGLILAFTLALPTGNSDDVIYAALKSGVDQATTVRLLDAYENALPTSVLGASFFLGLIGAVLLGIAVLLGRSAPVWAGATLAVAPILIPVAWFAGLPTIAAVIPWALFAIGLGGVTLPLLGDRRR